MVYDPKHKSSMATVREPQGLNHKETVAMGEAKGITRINKFGRNDGIVGTEVVIAANSIYGMPATADYVKPESIDPEDIVGGDGAWTILLHGVGENFEKLTEIVNMGEQSIHKYLRVYIARVWAAGTITPTNGGNFKDIEIKQVTTPFTPMVVIPEHEGSTLCACFTVPANHYALISYADTTTGNTKQSLNRLKIRATNRANAPFTTEGLRDNFENQVGRELSITARVDEKHDVVFTGVSDSAGANVSAAIMIELREKKYGN